MAHSSEHAAPEQQHGLRPRQYLVIGAALTVITIVELGLSQVQAIIDALGGLLTPVLIFLSAVKFAVVVAYFMHLRFESGLMARIFVGSFVLATLILFALMGLFWGDLAGGIQAARQAVPH